MNRNKGITLVALVITIIVLLILAGVSVAILVGPNGILTQVGDAKIKTKEAEIEEHINLWKLDNEIRNENNKEKITSKQFIDDIIKQGVIKEEDVDRVYKTINIGELKISYLEKGELIPGVLTNKDTVYIDINEEKVTIPKGFYVSEQIDEQIIQDGIVIKDENENEFVWIPVDEPTNMYSGNIEDKETLQGKLYTKLYTNDITEEPSEDAKEPVATTYEHSNYEDDITIDEYQEEFQMMIKSVVKNKGFYISRYEMSTVQIVEGEKNINIPESKENKKPANGKDNNMWFGLYYIAELYKNTNNADISSCMVWGSQYDQMLKWFVNSGIDISSKELLINGKEDKFKNIYSLITGKQEWTQAAKNNIMVRVIKGGNYGHVNDRTLASSSTSYPFADFDINTTRFTLIF